ncbi:leucine-rich_repeat domain-containing protein [Hexamita inflata]|uniref:Leucine-rich repeat domain-containing protein n=1 Tax=Hexamita inflata TaxID=28002 RepID=A0AA86QGG9_9EUKA|nr:leucine-rich repeat domain-containing protein [Hexamita inflata]
MQQITHITKQQTLLKLSLDKCDANKKMQVKNEEKLVKLLRVLTINDLELSQGVANGKHYALDIFDFQELLPNTALDLGHKKLVNISLLAALVNLQNLSLVRNEIVDLNPLSGLNLVQLNISQNCVVDLAPLKTQANLQNLTMSLNSIQDLTPVSGLANLLQLDVAVNYISDISPLRFCTKIQNVYLSCNKISDISPLAHLKDLVFLAMFSNQVQDLSPLQSLRSLATLYVWENRIVSVYPVSELPELKVLNVSYNRVVDVQPLRHTNLAQFQAQHNLISDLDPVRSHENFGKYEIENQKKASRQEVDLSKRVTSVQSAQSRLQKMKARKNSAMSMIKETKAKIVYQQSHTISMFNQGVELFIAFLNSQNSDIF